MSYFKKTFLLNEEEKRKVSERVEKEIKQMIEEYR